MCLAIPGQIVEFGDPQRQLAKVDVSGVRRVINVGLVAPDGLAVGDWVLIHVGFALSKIDEEQARWTLDFLSQASEDFRRELDDMSGSAIE
jgi:hydrogenase expression/formation protein HypC